MGPMVITVFHVHVRTFQCHLVQPNSRNRALPTSSSSCPTSLSSTFGTVVFPHPFFWRDLPVLIPKQQLCGAPFIYSSFIYGVPDYF